MATAAARADFIKEVEAISPELCRRTTEAFLALTRQQLLEVLDIMEPGSATSLGATNPDALWNALTKYYVFAPDSAAIAVNEKIVPATSFFIDILISTTASATYIGIDNEDHINVDRNIVRD